MFQGLRQGSPFFIFSKADLKTDIGEVVSVSNPVPQYPTSFNSGTFGPTNVVDILVKVGDEQINFNKIRADLSIADANNGMVVVSDNRDAIIAEIENYQKTAQKKLDDVPNQEHIVAACTEMLTTLSPQIRLDAERQAEIDGIKKQLLGMDNRFDKLESLLTRALKGGSKNSE